MLRFWFAASGNEPVWFVRGNPRDHGKGNLPWLQQLLALLARDDLAARRQDARDSHEVALLDARVAQRQLETTQLVLVGPDTFGQKNLRWNKMHVVVSRLRAEEKQISCSNARNS